MAAAGAGLAEGGEGGAEEGAVFPAVGIEGIRLEAAGEGGGEEEGAVGSADLELAGGADDAAGEEGDAVEFAIAGEDLVEFGEGAGGADAAEGGEPGLEVLEPVDLAEGAHAGG